MPGLFSEGDRHLHSLVLDAVEVFMRGVGRTTGMDLTATAWEVSWVGAPAWGQKDALYGRRLLFSARPVERRTLPFFALPLDDKALAQLKTPFGGFYSSVEHVIASPSSSLVPQPIMQDFHRPCWELQHSRLTHLQGGQIEMATTPVALLDGPHSTTLRAGARGSLNRRTDSADWICLAAFSGKVDGLTFQRALANDFLKRGNAYQDGQVLWELLTPELATYFRNYIGVRNVLVQFPAFFVWTGADKEAARPEGWVRHNDDFDPYARRRHRHAQG